MCWLEPKAVIHGLVPTKMALTFEGDEPAGVVVVLSSLHAIWEARWGRVRVTLIFVSFMHRNSEIHVIMIINSVHLCINWTGRANIWSHYPHYTALYQIINLGCNPSQAREKGDWVLPEHGRTQGWEYAICVWTRREREREGFTVYKLTSQSSLWNSMQSGGNLIY
jgi:hypothetical protein